MCGIFGSPNLTPSICQMLPFIGLEMEARGRDAWGCTNGEEVLKFVGPLSETWASVSAEFSDWKMGLFHTRGASTGSPKSVDNAHPFVYPKADGTYVIGIHNGIVSSHPALNAKYGRHCEVDSMHLWMNLAEGKDWADISGWGNLAWFEKVGGIQIMNLCRFNNDALHLVCLEGGEWLFASTKAPLILVSKVLGNPVKFHALIEEYYHYWFVPDADGHLLLYKSDKPLTFAKPVYPAHNGSYMGRPFEQRTSACYKCDYGLVLKDEVICQTCLNQLIYEFKHQVVEVTS